MVQRQRSVSLGLLALLAVLLIGVVGVASWFAFGSSRPSGAAAATLDEVPAAVPVPATTRSKAPQIAAPGTPVPAPEPAQVATPAPRAEEERAEVGSIAERELSDAIWVEGVVHFPENTPLDETVEVIAAGKKFKSREWHRAKVGRDGAFRVAFAKDTKTGRLQLDAPHLYLADPFSVRLVAPPDSIVLAPQLGGRILGVALPPPGVTDAFAVLKDRGVQLSGWSSSTGDNAQRFGKFDEHLRFELRGIPPHMETSLHCDPEVWSQVRLQDVKVSPGEDKSVELRLELGVRLAGRVIDEAGKPVPGAKLQAHSAHVVGGSSWSDSRDAKLAADGSFTLQGVQAGDVDLVADEQGFLPAKLELGKLADGDAKEGIEVRLATGHFVAGRVQWPDGRPCAGATLHVEERRSEDDVRIWGQTDKPLQSGADGGFRITGLGPGPYDVLALGAKDPASESSAAVEASATKKLARKKAPKWSAKSERVAADEGALVLTLRESLALSGRVTDDTGAPVARFRLAATPVDQNNDVGWTPLPRGVVVQKYESDDGSFVLEGLREGEWRVSTTAKGYVGESDRQIVLPRDGDAQTIVIARASSISGTVVDPDGHPAANAKVHADVDRRDTFYYWPGNDEFSDTTDEQGRFAIESAPTGNVRIVALRDGLAGSEPLHVDVAPAQRLENVALRLRRGGRVSGEIASSGAAKAGRTISLQPREGGEWRQETSDAAGKFEFANVVPGKYTVSAQPGDEELAKLPKLDGQAEWRARESLTPSAAITIAEGETEHVVLGAPPRAPVEVSGTVLRGATPIENAQVFAFRQDAADGGQRQTFGQTDAKGRYALTLDEPGSYSFSVQTGAGGTQTSRSEKVPEASTFTVDFELPSGRIAGRVLGPTGEPLGEAMVSLSLDRGERETRSQGVYGWVRTGDSGTFEFGDLPAGTFSVTVDDQPRWTRHGVEDALGRVRRGDLVLREGGEITGVEIKLVESSAIEGLVRLPSGAVAAGAAIFVRDEKGEIENGWSNEFADSAGHYRVDGLAPGTWTVSARLQNNASAESREVRLGAKDKATVDLDLRPGTMLRVDVEDSNGAPVGASLSVRDDHGREWAGMRSQVDPPRDNSNLIVGPLPPGRYRVVATNHDGGSANGTADLHGEAQSSIRVKFGGS